VSQTAGFQLSIKILTCH